MTIEYCCWYHPDEDPEDVKREIEDARRCGPRSSTRGSREHPPVIEWKLNWPPFSVDPDHPICHAIADAHELAAAGTRFAGRPEVHGFAAVEDVSFLNLGGVTAVSYGPGDLRVAHADDEYVLIDELVTATKTYAAARHGVVRHGLASSYDVTETASSTTYPSSTDPVTVPSCDVPPSSPKTLSDSRLISPRLATLCS